jgi:hypothetical protein
LPRSPDSPDITATSLRKYERRTGYCSAAMITKHEIKSEMRAPGEMAEGNISAAAAAVEAGCGEESNIIVTKVRCAVIGPSRCLSR